MCESLANCSAMGPTVKAGCKIHWTVNFVPQGRMRVPAFDNHRVGLKIEFLHKKVSGKIARHYQKHFDGYVDW